MGDYKFQVLLSKYAGNLFMHRQVKADQFSIDNNFSVLSQAVTMGAGNVE